METMARCRPGLPSWLSAVAGMVVPVMSSSTAKPMSELPEIFLIAASGPTWRSGRPTERSPLMPMESTWAAVGPMRTTESSSRCLEGQDAAFVLQQDGRVFAGLLDDFGVGLDGLRGDFVFGLAVEIAEVDDFVEHAAGGAGDGGFSDGAVLQGFRHFLRV